MSFCCHYWERANQHTIQVSLKFFQRNKRFRNCQIIKNERETQKKNTTDTATVNNETKRKLSHYSNELESFPKKQKLQLSESEKLKKNQDSNDWLTNYFDDQSKRQKEQQLNNISRHKRRQMPE